MPTTPKKQAEPKGLKSRNQSRTDAVTAAYEKDDEKGHGYSHWERELGAYKKSFNHWENRCDRIMDVYAGSSSTPTLPRARYNIFFSVIQTLSPAVYARTPRADVSRRFKDTDPAARVASLLLERALEFEIDSCSDYRSAINHCVFDYLTAGRAVAWLRYEPHIKAKTLDQPTDGLMVTEDSDEPDEELVGEQTRTDYVHYKEFAYTASARTWEEVTWVARYVYMNKDAVKARFGEEIADQLPYDAVPDSNKLNRNKLDINNIAMKQAEIIEIWCRETKMVYWLSKSMGRILERKDDPLGLPNFFPCPRPLLFGLINDSLIPNPLYVQLQDACESLNILAERQRALIEGMKLRGIYDAQYKELARLLSEGEDNALVPVANYAKLSESGGLQNAIQLLDLSQQGAALSATFEAMNALQQQVYDLSGVSDVMRGMSDPSETATAQAIKSVNGQNRLKTMQLAVANFAQDILKLKAALICQQYSDETILRIACADQLSMVDQQLVPQALMILRDEPMRGFKIEVSADSLILLDEAQEKTDRMELISAVGGYFQQALPLVAQTPELAPLAIELLKFAASGFKAGKTVEGVLDQTADEFRAQFEQSKGQPKPPPPEIQKLQMQTQADAQKFQAEQQAKQAEMQMMLQAKQLEMQQNAEAENQKMQLQMQADQAKMQMEIQFKREEAQLKTETERATQLYQAEQEKERLQLADARAQRELEMKMKLEQQKMLTERNTKLMELHYKAANSISVEQVRAGISDGTEDETRELALAEAMSAHPMQPAMDAMTGGVTQIAQLLNALQAHQTAPRRIIRDESGRAIGAEIEVPEMAPIEPNLGVAVMQKLPAHNINAELGNHANKQLSQIADVILQMTEATRKPRQVIRDENGVIVGVH